MNTYLIMYRTSAGKSRELLVEAKNDDDAISLVKSQEKESITKIFIVLDYGDLSNRQTWKIT